LQEICFRLSSFHTTASLNVLSNLRIFFLSTYPVILIRKSAWKLSQPAIRRFPNRFELNQIKYYFLPTFQQVTATSTIHTLITSIATLYCECRGDCS
jgi:hypothetical protein